jgi:hypothetical protein
VARAKRTTRAEARRRYRASLADPLEDDLEDGDDESLPAAPASRSSGGSARAATGGPAASASAAAARPGVGAAFRSSFRPLDLRGDLRALPGLLRTRAFLLPLILAGLAVAIVPFAPENSLVLLFFQYFAGAAPFGAAFIAGFLAPRASWLIGGLVALATVGFEALAFTGHYGGLLDTIPGVSPADAKAVLLSQALTYGVPMSMFFAAAAAWYKRFLNRANPNRNRPTQAGRRPDGKHPKRNEQRPILARRR